MTLTLDGSRATGDRQATSPQSPFPAAEQLATVVSNASVNREYKHLIVACAPPATEAAPGQFFHLLCPMAGEDTPYLRRPRCV